MSMADTARTLGLGFSPCHNDTFMFHALVKGKVEVEEVRLVPELLDIEELNCRALRIDQDKGKKPLGKRARPLLVTKLSIPALACLCLLALPAFASPPAATPPPNARRRTVSTVWPCRKARRARSRR